MLYGGARITAVDAGGRSFVRDVFEGDLWYFPTGIPHSIQGLEPDGAEFLLVFDDGHFSEYETVLLSTSCRTRRRSDVERFRDTPRALAGIPAEELFIFQAPVPGPLHRDQNRAAGTIGPSPCDFSFRPGEQAKAKQTNGRRSPDCRLDDIPGIDYGRGGDCDGTPRRHARASLAPECG